jgi:hypothetical protein
MANSPVESGRGPFDRRASKGVTFAALILRSKAAKALSTSVRQKA